MKTTRPFSGRQGGFTLIEALTSLAVTAFGMLAVAGFYVTLSQNADVSKQRSEAVRLAQLKMEELRAFEQVAADGVGNRFDYTDDVVSGNDTVDANNGAYATNTSYARTWTVTGNGTDPQKWILVEVTWTDRTSNGQSVVLRSVISRSDAAGIGTLAVGPGPVKPRSPKNRSVDIPYPAVNLAGGLSGFTPPGGGSPFFVFDNVTGEVLGECTTARAEGATITFGSGGCTAFTTRAYLVTGYIRFVAGSFNLSDFVNPAGPAQDLDAAIDLDVGTGTPVCYAQRQKVLSAGNIAAPRNISGASRTSNVVTLTTSGNHGFSAGQVVSVNSATHVSFNGVFVLLTASGNSMTYAQTAADESFSGGTPASTVTQVQEITVPETQAAPTGYNAVVSTFVAYTCVVTPTDDDSNPSTPNRWWGKFRITPSGWVLGTTSAESKLCRYTGDYVSDGQVSNSEHPLYYRGVTGTLDHQNYVVIDGHRNCPTDSAVNTATGKYTNVNTTVHQTNVSGGGGDLSGTNAGGANNNGGFTSAEPAYSTTVAIPMF